MEYTPKSFQGYYELQCFQEHGTGGIVGVCTDV